MKSRYSGECSECSGLWGPGDEIVKLLGEWVHPACKAAHLGSMDKTITYERPDRAWLTESQLRPKRGRTRGIRNVM